MQGAATVENATCRDREFGEASKVTCELMHAIWDLEFMRKKRLMRGADWAPGDPLGGDPNPLHAAIDTGNVSLILLVNELSGGVLVDDPSDVGPPDHRGRDVDPLTNL